MAEAPLLEVSGLRKSFSRGGAAVAALDGVDLTVARGETLALAGASGSGKTTLARCIMRLIEPDARHDPLRRHGTAPRFEARRCAAQAQNCRWSSRDPIAALNPRATVARILEDPLRVHGLVPRSGRRDARARSAAPCPAAAPRSPIAGRTSSPAASASASSSPARSRRRPDLIVLDEPVSALDVSVRAQILNLLMDLQAETGVAYLLVSHDLAVVRAIAERMAIMAAGRIVESGPTEQLLTAPQAPATKALLDAVPRLEVGRSRA